MSDLVIYEELEQGTTAWHQARCGVITASTIGQLVTPSLKVADNDKSRGLVLSLAAERVSQYVEESFPSADMQRGIDDEPKARAEYEKRNNLFVTEVGFMTRQFEGVTIGYSPDGLVGDTGLIEVKSRRQKTQLGTWLEDEVPAVNMAQLQCGLLVSGREWIDYLSFAEGWPMYVKRVAPDPSWHEALIAAAIQADHLITSVVDRYLERTAGMTPSERTPDIQDLEF